MFGSEAILTHEIGHALDLQYGLTDFLLGLTPQAKAKLQAAGTPAPKSPYAFRKVTRELRALAEERLKGLDPQAEGYPQYRSYVRGRREMIANLIHASVHAPELLEQIAPTTKKRLAAFIKAHPEVKPLFDLRPGLAVAERHLTERIGGMVINGHWFMPRRAAAIVNNYLGDGMRGWGPYDLLLGWNNALNTLQLSWDAFQLFFISAEATINHFAVALDRGLRGQKGALSALPVSAALAPTVIGPTVRAYYKGKRLREEYLKEQDEQEALAPVMGRVMDVNRQLISRIADAVEVAGGRVDRDSLYRIIQPKTVKDTFTMKRVEKLFFLDVWINDILIPTVKLGAFADLAATELAHYGPQDDPQALQQALQQAWDSVDNRMGQLTHDNQFMNKVLQHGFMAAFRAFGFRFGPIKEAVGATTDTARLLKSAGRTLKQPFNRGGGRGGGGGGGRGGGGAGPGGFDEGWTPPPSFGRRAPLITNRQLYMLLSLSFGTVVVASIWQFMMGVWERFTHPERAEAEGFNAPLFPEMAEDFHHPRSGRIKPNGKPERISPPTRAKDYFNYLMQPGRSLYNARAPGISYIEEVISNRTYDGVYVRDITGNYLDQFKQLALHLGKSFLPVSYAEAYERWQTSGDWAETGLPLMVQGAPTWVDRTAAEELLDIQLSRQMAAGPRAPGDYEEQQARRAVMEDLQRQMRGEPGTDRLFQELETGRVSPRDMPRIYRRLARQPLARKFEMLTMENALPVFKRMNRAEREQTETIMRRKIGGAKLQLEKSEQVWQQFNDAMDGKYEPKRALPLGAPIPR